MRCLGIIQEKEQVLCHLGVRFQTPSAYMYSTASVFLGTSENFLFFLAVSAALILWTAGPCGLGYCSVFRPGAGNLLLCQSQLLVGLLGLRIVKWNGYWGSGECL